MALNKNIKTLKLIQFLIVIVLLILSCKKEEVRPDTIIIGNPSNMLINIYDTILKSPFPTYADYINLDIDNDNIIDFKLKSVYGIHPEGLMTFKYSEIDYLDNEGVHQDALLLYSTEQFDTLFFTRDTLYDPEINTVHIYRNEACENVDNNYSISRISKVLTVLQDGDEIRKEDNFLHNGFRFYYRNSDYSMDINDTIVFHTNFANCISFPNDEVVYIGIKRLINGDIKLGWIKLNVSGRQIHLLESAIQK